MTVQCHRGAVVSTWGPWQHWSLAPRTFLYARRLQASSTDRRELNVSGMCEDFDRDGHT